MPTERFYRLPEEKREAICDAVRKEFAKVPFEKASINQIVRNANISRGSFYTYFSDKRDAMEFVLDDDFTRMRCLCEDTLESNDGEYLGMLRTLFEYLIQRMQSTSEIRNIVKHVLSYNENQLFSEISAEAQALLLLGASAVVTYIRYYYQYPDRLDEVRSLLETTLDILWHGVYQCQPAQG